MWLIWVRGCKSVAVWLCHWLSYWLECVTVNAWLWVRLCDRVTVTNCPIVGMASANIGFRHLYLCLCAFMQLSKVVIMAVILISSANYLLNHTKYVCAKDRGWRAFESIHSGTYGGKPCNRQFIWTLWRKVVGKTTANRTSEKKTMPSDCLNSTAVYISSVVYLQAESLLKTHLYLPVSFIHKTIKITKITLNSLSGNAIYCSPQNLLCPICLVIKNRE